MKISSKTILALAGSLALMFSVGVMAHELKEAGSKPSQPSPEQQAEMSHAASLASQLIQFGKAKKSPLALVTAVQILDESKLELIQKDSDVPYNRSDLLAEAKTLAAGKPELLEVIKDAAANQPKHFVLGWPHCHWWLDGYGNYAYVCH